MSRWFRHYAGMMRDEKLVRVAVKATQPVERVIWVWGALLESASEVNDGGRYDFDADEASYFLRCDGSDVVSILTGLEDSGRLSKGVVVRWGDRQFDSDSSRERQKRYRERQDRNANIRQDDAHNSSGDGKAPSRDGGVTAQEYRDRNIDRKEADDARASHEVSCEEEELLRGAAGASLNAASPSLLSMAEPIRWCNSGMDFHLDILPAIRIAATHGPPGKVRSWAYFAQAVADYHATRTAPMPDGSVTPIRGRSTLAAFDRIIENEQRLQTAR